MHRILILCSLLVFQTACEDKKNTRQMSSSKDLDKEHLASQPAPVTGSYLSCAYIEDPTAAATSPVGCNPYDANRQEIDLDSFGNDVRWTYESALTVAFTKNFVDAKGVRWQGRFDFTASDLLDKLPRILETKVVLNFVKKSNGEPVLLQDKIRNLLIELAEHRYIKIAYQSIFMNTPATTPALPDTVDFEFKINGVWERVKVKVETLDPVARTMSSDRFSFRFTGSDADFKMYLMTGMGRDLVALLSNNLDSLRWNTPAGTGWTFDPTSSFSNTPPYDLKETMKPIELVIDMGVKQRFHGFRLDGGLPNPGRTLPNGFPDRFSFLYSDDNKTWTKIPGSESTLEGRSLLEWSWDP